MSRILDGVVEFMERTEGFDWVDRIIVTTFMLITVLLLIFLLSQELTETEQAEIAPVIEILANVPFFFFIWPILLLGLTATVRFAINRYHVVGESA